jgi:hypothetical protein
MDRGQLRVLRHTRYVTLPSSSAECDALLQITLRAASPPTCLLCAQAIGEGLDKGRSELALAPGRQVISKAYVVLVTRLIDGMQMVKATASDTACRTEDRPDVVFCERLVVVAEEWHSEELLVMDH